MVIANNLLNNKIKVNKDYGDLPPAELLPPPQPARTIAAVAATASAPRFRRLLSRRIPLLPWFVVLPSGFDRVSGARGSRMPMLDVSV